MINRTVKVGKREITISKQLLDLQDCWEELNAIKDCHKQILEIFNKMEEEKDPEILVSLDKLVTDIEFELQYLWGFPKDPNFHRFWDRQKCLCPKMDNDDRYPTGNYIVAGNCPLHGEG